MAGTGFALGLAMIRALSWMMCAGAIAMGCGGLERAALRREAGRVPASRAVVIDSSARERSHPAVTYDLTCTAERCEPEAVLMVPARKLKGAHTAALPSILFADSLEVRLNDATSIILNDAGDLVSKRASAKPLLTAQLRVRSTVQTSVY